MKFYDRETELQELHRLDDLSHSVSQFTVLIGRRRTGKTTLLVKAFEHRKYLYCFVGKKSE
ncbi:MAG: ATPase, partial [Muribaculaceae bacterium]|nr:ATPase [Muribaculaceae bacterium]